MTVLRSVRRRVRLRTRLRRARTAWRDRTPRRLPEWPQPPPPRATGASADPVRVDAALANPRGRQRYGPRLPTGHLHLAGGGWEIRQGATRVVAGRPGDPLDPAQAAVLARLGTVICPPDPPPAPPDPPAYAHLLVTLAMTGVVVHAPHLPAAVSARLAPDLAGLIRAPLPGRAPDAWELRSVRQRRAALRHHAAGLARPSVSALLVSRRPHRVAPAVAALAAQTYPDLEIVVCGHGCDLPASLPADRAVRVRSVPAGRTLGEALAEAARAATGALLTKVDDDDRYGPEHVWDLVLARHFAGGQLTGKGAEFVHLAGKRVTVRRRMAAETPTDTVAGGTILIGREDLAAVGGWPPVPRSVDRALLDRVLAGGGAVYRTHPFGFIYTRHGEGHTWDAEPGYFLHDARRRWRGLPPPEQVEVA